MKLTSALIADAAVVERGKLYIHGAGWDTIWAASVPTTHPAMALTLLFRVEYSEALQDIPLLIELLDEDDAPVNNLRVEGQFNVGHPPGSRPGDPILVPQAITLTMLQFPKHGRYRFRVTSGQRELGDAGFRIAPLGPGGQVPGVAPAQ